MGKILNKNRLFKVERQNLTVRGKGVDYYRIVKKDTAVILPFLDKDHILLERQYRPPIGLKIFEIPAGHLKNKDTPISAAKRELEEETGYKCSRLKLLAVTYPSPGILSNKEYIYMAEGLKKGKLSLDKDEEISHIGINIRTAIKMIKTNEIRDAKTIVAILYYKSFMMKSE
jgi:ADP-ribose pyrophosphatase